MPLFWLTLLFCWIVYRCITHPDDWFWRIAMVATAGAMALSTQPACAAEAVMPIKVTIVRCVTTAERIQNCHHRGLCCDLIKED